MKTPTMLTSRKVILLPVGSIHPNPMQPRKIFDPDALGELTESIRMYGVLQPLTVRKAGDGSFELVAGERRLRASRAAGLDKALLCGGVASSALFRGMLEERLSRAGGVPEVCFGDPELSGDNAVGVALIGADEYRKNRGGSHVCSRS